MGGWMTRATLGLFTTALVGALAVSASAQNSAVSSTTTDLYTPSTGLYLGGGAGVQFQEPNRFRGGDADNNTNYNTGYVGLLNLGYGLGNGFRAEFEPGWHYNSVHEVGGVSGSGHTDAISLMVNGLYDFYIPALNGLTPHLGVGVGAARVHSNSNSSTSVPVSGNDWVPAFQGIAGVDYPIMPQLRLGLDYRYFIAHDTDFHNGITGATVKGGDFNDHEILVTLRWQFGARAQPAVYVPPAPVAAPPAAAAAPPPPVARNYTVYFDLDKATLTETGRQVVAAAAANFKQGQVAHIDVTGHTDTTGSARHNQGLSERRAATVRAELIRDGVAPDQIVTRGLGESDLAVPTAAGVNEPRNRRVVIVEQSPGT
jgi:OmpA-OmpF porin, OOP family